jgi:hypothetical protein
MSVVPTENSNIRFSNGSFSFYKTKTMNITERVVCYVNNNMSVPCPGWDPSTTITTQEFRSTVSGQVGNSVNFTIPSNAPVGTEYCFYAQVLDNGEVVSGANKGGKSSGKYCIRVIKGPTLQVHGGDSWAGANCNGAVSAGNFIAKDPSDLEGVQSATWSQYGLFARGSIDDGFGSGGWIKPLSSKNLEHSKWLKFAQNPDSGQFIGRDKAHCTTDILGYYQQRFAGSKDPDEANIANILSGARPTYDSNGRTLWYGEGNKTLDVSGVDFYDRDLVIVVDGDITINGDVAIYNHSYRSIENLPNLMVMASGNIIVEPGVTRLDGVYVAQGTFFDCGDKSILGLDGMSNDFSLGGVCDQQLVVNGAVVANNTRFHRTHRGSDGIDDNIFNPTPAEIIKYPVGVWLQSYDHYRSLSNRITTMFYREVAPRV